MKSGSNMPCSSASEYLIYSYKRVPGDRQTTSIRWHLAWKCLIFADILSLFIGTIPVIHCAIAWQNQQNDLCAQRNLRSAWASAQSDQRLRWVKDQTFIDADSEDKRMLRLIWVFAWRTCSIVGFVMWRLIFVLISAKTPNIPLHIW